MIEQDNNHWKTATLVHPYGRGVNFQLMIKSVEPILQSLREKNYPLFDELSENWYRVNNTLFGNKEFLVKDPDGYVLRFAEDIGSRPYQ
jgi:hypothetical protein